MSKLVRHAVAGVSALTLAAIPQAMSAQAAAQAPATTTPPTLSGTIRGNYHYLLGGPREDFNQFALERVYVTVKGTPAPKLDYRVTTDVFQSGDGNGWTVRLKYGYLDYGFGVDQPWETRLRAGVLQTVTIEQQETYWPRWLGPVAIDRHGFFQSADAGVATQTALPNGLGEVYLHVVNGNGYVRRETDRFKDLGGRLSLTPFSSSENKLLASTTISGWVYDGAAASAFVNDTIAPVATGLNRDRWGVHAAMKDPRLTLAADYSVRADDVERGTNRPLDPRTVTARDGAVASGFAIVRPLAFASASGTSPLALIGRYDRVEPDDARDDDAFHYFLAGGIYDINKRFSMSLNYQEQLGGVAPSPFRGVFANIVVDF